VRYTADGRTGMPRNKPSADRAGLTLPPQGHAETWT
jgi:hypothetical protein